MDRMRKGVVLTALFAMILTAAVPKFMAKSRPSGAAIGNARLLTISHR